MAILSKGESVSKVAKQVIVLLFLLLVAACGLAMFTVMEKEKVTKTKVALEKQFTADNKKLRGKVKELERIKIRAEKKLSNVETDIFALNKRVKNLTSERDDQKKSVDALKQERDGLLVKLREKPAERIVYKSIERESPTSVPGAEAYWAQILKIKASLEVELENLRVSLSKSTIEMGELKKENADLQLALSRLENEKALIEREVKHGSDLSETLSLQLARAQNEKKFLSNRLGKIQGESSGLHKHVTQLIATKIALEKTIVRLKEEKKDIEGKVTKTENVMQSRVYAIQDIRDNLEKIFKRTPGDRSMRIELPPIIVSARAPGTDPDSFFVVKMPRGDFSEIFPGVDGNIVSVNEANNFVIVDIGEESGVRLGDTLNVYRGAEYIAGLKVIQVRRDIAAADIKEKIVKIQVGDAVR